MKKILMASLALTCFAAAIALFQFSSCTKVKAETGCVGTIDGLWIGTYTDDQHPEYGTPYWSVIVKPDGTMITDTKGPAQVLAIGTWTLSSADSLTCKTNVVYGVDILLGLQQTITCKYNKTAGTLTGGVWITYPGGTSTGKFTAMKVN